MSALDNGRMACALVRFGYALARSNYGPGAGDVDGLRREVAQLRAELAVVTGERNGLLDELNMWHRPVRRPPVAPPVLRPRGDYADLDVQRTRSGVPL